MKFHEGSKVEFKSNSTKYSGTVFIVHIDEDLEFEQLIQLEGPNGLLLTVSENSVQEVSTQLSYKGYKTLVKFDEESNVYHGHLVGIVHLVTWESDTLEDCENQFHLAVDDYLCFKEAVLNEESK